jgi:hypothetical protein
MVIKTLIISIFAFQALSFTSIASGQGTWETTLQARDINGDGVIDAYYDTSLNITWLANSNLAAGSIYDDDEYAEFIPGGNTKTDGAMLLENARIWAATLNVYGETGWRLPNSGYNFHDPEGDRGIYELDHLYKITLGNNYLYEVNPGLTNLGPFSNIKTDRMYWIETETVESWYAWAYGLNGSGGGGSFSNEIHYIWAVKDGDVNTVPEPSNISLLLAGLLLCLYRFKIN